MSKLSKFLSELITPSIRNNLNSLKDSTEFAKIIKDFKIKNNEIMQSFDVVNLFTNIPIPFTLSLIQQKLINDLSLKDRTKIPVHEIITLIKLCLENIIFTFNNKIYQQITGAGMGCNLSPIVAECLVSYIFDRALNTFKNPPNSLNFLSMIHS